MCCGGIDIYFSSLFSHPFRSVGGWLHCSLSVLVDGRVEEATLPRLVSIYSGFPRFPRLCRARSASPVCIILYLFRLVTSYTRPASLASRPLFSSHLPIFCLPLAYKSRALYTREWHGRRRTSFSSQLSPEWRHIRESEMGYTSYKKIHDAAFLSDTFHRIFSRSLSAISQHSFLSRVQIAYLSFSFT